MNSSSQTTLARLLGLIDNNPGFAGSAASVKVIGSIVDAEDEDIKEIVKAILRDAALAARVLRLANSSRSALAGRNVSTIDRAITVLGFNTVRSIALSLGLLDGLTKKSQSDQLHAEIVAACFCGSLSFEITRCLSPSSGPQEAQIFGLLQNIGRVMALYYLYDDFEKCRELQISENLTEDEAIRQTLGIDFEGMGAAIAGHWNLPEPLEKIIAAKMSRNKPKLPPELNWNQYAALFSRCITDILFRLPEIQEKTEISNYIRIFSGVLKLQEGEAISWIYKAQRETEMLLADIGFPCSFAQARAILRRSSERVVDRLSAKDTLTQKDVFDPKKKIPLEVFQQSLRVIHDAFGFSRTLLCLPEGISELAAVVGLGGNAIQIASKFRCRGEQPDIFRMMLARQADIYVSDVSAPAIAPYIPGWYQSLVGARAFLLMPVVHEGKKLGLLYGDFDEPPAESPQPIMAQERVKACREQLKEALLSRLGKMPR